MMTLTQCNAHLTGFNHMVNLDTFEWNTVVDALWQLQDNHVKDDEHWQDIQSLINKITTQRRHD